MISRGNEEKFQLGGEWFKGIEGLELSAVPAQFGGEGSLSGNALLPWRYRAW